MTDAYGFLGIPSSATADEVKSAYWRLARIHHPDRYVNAPAEAREEAAVRMAELNAALRAIEEGRGAQWRASERTAEMGRTSEREVMFRRWEEAERAKRVVASGTHQDRESADPSGDEDTTPAQPTRVPPVDPAVEVWQKRNERVAQQAEREVERLATEEAARREEAEREREQWRSAMETGAPKKRRLFKKRWER